MRVLHFLRPARASATARKAEGSTDALGLDAFATEASAQAPVQAAGTRLRVALVLLGAVAVLESVPAVLWLQGWLKPAEPTVLAATPIATPLPAVIAATPPCAPAQGSAPAAVSAGAAAARPGEGTGAAPARAVAPAMMAGLVSIDAPVTMHVYSEGRLIGTTEADTIMLPVGAHELELVSDAVGFRARRSVSVQAGRTTSLRVEAPRVPIHVNAVPWAEVWIDNQRIGETPIGNLQQTIGPHEIVFRHPELGERRTTVLVTLKEPARVSMDLRKR